MAFVERHQRRYSDGRVLRNWRARYRDPSGRERSKTFQRRSDAEKFLAIVESEKLRGEWTDPRLAQVMLGEWAERWMATTAHLKPKTRSGYESLLRTLVLPRFGEVSLGRVEPLMIREWVADMVAEGLSSSRIRQAYRLLAAIFRAAVESGYLTKSPCIGVSLPRMPQKEMRFLSAEQVRALANAVGEIGSRGNHYRTLVYVLAFTGIRWGEAAALRRRRVDVLRGRLEIVESLADVNGQLLFGPTKTHQIRTVALPRFLREILACHLEDVGEGPDSLVFTSGGGRPLRSQNFARRVWRPAPRNRTPGGSPGPRPKTHLRVVTDRSGGTSQGDPASARASLDRDDDEPLRPPLRRRDGRAGRRSGLRVAFCCGPDADPTRTRGRGVAGIEGKKAT